MIGIITTFQVGNKILLKCQLCMDTNIQSSENSFLLLFSFSHGKFIVIVDINLTVTNTFIGFEVYLRHH